MGRLYGDNAGKDKNLTPEQIGSRFSEEINAELEIWAKEFLEQIQRSAKKKLKTDTGKGYNSFNYALEKAGGREVAAALFEFEPYQRLYDMRKVQWSNQPPVDVFEDWIERKGLVDKFLPKYKRKHKYVPTDRKALVNKMAWGIVKNMTGRGKWTGKKRWYNKSKEAAISDLYGRLIDAVYIAWLRSN